MFCLACVWQCVHTAANINTTSTFHGLRSQNLMATFWTSSRFGSSSEPLFMRSHTWEKLANWHSCGIQSKADLQTAESYPEAIKCLHNCYHRPRITHREHVQSILQVPIMEANNGKELQKLYDVCKQHLRAIQLSSHFDLETILTIAIELKMDEATNCFRQKFFQISADTTHLKLPRGLVRVSLVSWAWFSFCACALWIIA